jgi:hypothetical protein
VADIDTFMAGMVTFHRSQQAAAEKTAADKAGTQKAGSR